MEYRRMDSSELKAGEPGVNTRRLIRNTVLFFVGIMLIYFLLFLFFREELSIAGTWAVENIGMPGVFIFVFLVDCFIVPATADLVFPLSMEWNPIALLMVMSAASILGGAGGFFIGGRLSHLKFVRKSVAYYRSKGENLIRRYGVWAIVIAGLTPVPYSTVSWIAGMVKMHPGLYLLASLSRIPRFFLYYAAIRAGLILLSPGA